MSEFPKANTGELVMFPCESENYQLRMGVLAGTHDNPTDATMRFYKDNPRQVADILYGNKMVTCWFHSVRTIR